MKKFFIPILLSLFLCSCATYYNPVTKKKERTLYSEKDEIDLGKAIDRKIRREFEIIPTPPEIQKIGERVAKSSDRPNLKYTFRIIKGKEINAFSIPGGFVYLYTGLLKITESEDEIACIIGHEIAHICARDSIHRLQKILLYSIPSSILFGSGRYKAIQKSVDMIFTLSMLKHSRSEELRADRLGVIYAFKAGYNPEGMLKFFRKLKKIKGKENIKLFVFLKDHPDIDERIKNIEETIKNLRKE
ncbi:MAG: hypothetical protein DRP67_02350 [Candidatus Omnitrophota bacterium]|nr:MAG: hypothetical protein DRP67_02350 [Candidatus Omnitrophota bacterium]HDN98055.1 hypothetical protein [bacterium]